MLRAERFDRVYDLQKSGRTQHYRRLVLPGVDWVGKRADEQAPGQIESFPAQLTAAGIAADHCLAPDVSWMADEVSELLAASGVTKPFVALIPGCSARHPHKRWPHYAALTTQLIAHGLDVVTAPGPPTSWTSPTAFPGMCCWVTMAT